MNNAKRRIGLEQEFVLVDQEGGLSNQADAFLARCWEISQAKVHYARCFVPEFVKSISAS